MHVHGTLAHHDPILVGLALVIGFMAAYTSLGLFARVRGAGRRMRLLWCAAATLVAGTGVWTTHFIAMLAFRPGLPVTYDLALTVLSALAAIGTYAIGFGIALRGSRPAIALGSAIGGLGISAMHWLGTFAMIVPARIVVDAGVAAGGVAWGVLLSLVAGLVVASRPGVSMRLPGAALFALAVAGMHFTGMAALGFEGAANVHAAGSTVPPAWLIAAVAGMALALVAFGALGAAVDDVMARRAQAEAEQLRHAVAELERTRADLSAALEAAAAASAAKSQFLAAMSHELRTPLNAIIGFAEIMEREMFGPLGNAQYRAYAGDVARSGAHLLRMVNDILDYSRIDASQVELDESELDSAGLVARAVRHSEASAHAAGITVVNACGPDLPLVRGDPVRLHQVLSHLLHNAIRFSRGGDTVWVAATCSADGLRIDVTDTGIGMSADEAALALQPFAQVDHRLERRYEGLGLGLSLARRLVERHGGRIALESQRGRGTTASIILPADRIIAPVPQAA